jgi:hypothetical protein
MAAGRRGAPPVAKTFVTIASGAVAAGAAQTIP